MCRLMRPRAIDQAGEDGKPIIGIVPNQLLSRVGVVVVAFGALKDFNFKQVCATLAMWHEHQAFRSPGSRRRSGK
jgi:hypothetical protein